MGHLIRLLFCCLVFIIGSFTTKGQQKVLLCTGKASHSYHKAYCTGLNHCKSPVIEVSLQTAIDKGRDPCDYCYGPEKSGAVGQFIVPRANTTKSKISSPAKCAALTKKGTRRSRTATSNGYCWQHG